MEWTDSVTVRGNRVDDVAEAREQIWQVSCYVWIERGAARAAGTRVLILEGQLWRHCDA